MSLRIRLSRLRLAALLAAVLLPLLGTLLPPDRWLLGLLFVAGGLIWRWRGWRAPPQRQTAVFASYVVALALAGYLGVASGWLLPAMAAGLVVWDVGLLLARLTAVDHISNEATLINQHLRWLLLVVALSLGLGGAALLVTISLTYTAAFLLALASLLGLGWVLRAILG